MRDFSCEWYLINKEDQFVKDSNTACWAGLQRHHDGKKYLTTNYSSTSEYAKDRMIYIDNYTYPATKEFIPLIVSVVNEITPCEIKKHDSKEYIAFKLLDTYDQSLILLNCIRYLWSAYAGFNTQKFFETLRDDKTYKDALERLLYANKKARTEDCIYSVGHSNIVYPKSDIKIRKAKELLTWTGNSTRLFLTGS